MPFLKDLYQLYYSNPSLIKKTHLEWEKQLTFQTYKPKFIDYYCYFVNWDEQSAPESDFSVDDSAYFNIVSFIYKKI